MCKALPKCQDNLAWETESMLATLEMQKIQRKEGSRTNAIVLKKFIQLVDQNENKFTADEMKVIKQIKGRKFHCLFHCNCQFFLGSCSGKGNEISYLGQTKCQKLPKEM